MLCPTSTSCVQVRPSLSTMLGEGLFLLFGVFARPATADSTAGALRVPPVDGLGEPAARAADRGVRLGELVGADCGRADAEAFGHVGDAQVFDGHWQLHPANNPARPAATANPAAMMCMPPNVLVAETTANSIDVTASFLCLLMMLVEPLDTIGWGSG